MVRFLNSNSLPILPLESEAGAFLVKSFLLLYFVCLELLLLLSRLQVRVPVYDLHQLLVVLKSIIVFLGALRRCWFCGPSLTKISASADAFSPRNKWCCRASLRYVRTATLEIFNFGLVGRTPFKKPQSSGKGKI
jgi:hypothetical protein